MKCRTCGTVLAPGALLCGECGTSAIAPGPTLGDTARYERRALLDAIATEQRRPSAETAAPAAASAPEHRHAAPPPRSRALFSLVFSTGESIRVAGPGLLGRNPTPAEGERVDYLVQIVDPARSVSKTHLAFGVDGDDFWVADRGSANGTRLGLHLVEVIELTPGARTVIPRGTRVGIGDQYFDVR